MKYVNLLFLALIASATMFSQNFKGRITDKSGEALYGSTVYIKEINQGLVCNESGYYQTILSPGIYNIEYKCLSYKTVRHKVKITEDEVTTLDIVLDESPFDLKEVSVSSNEDPAYRIIRKAIEKAPYYANAVNEYTADVYIKGNAELLKIASLFDKLAKKSEGVQLSDFKNKVFVQESFNQIQFTAPDKYKQTVKAFSSSIPDNFDSKDAMGIMNTSLYMPQFGSYISPLNPKAFSYYKFRYEGFSEEGEQIINKIRVEPKLKDNLLLDGYIYIVDNSWHIHSAELTSRGYGTKQTYTISFQKLDAGVFLPIGYVVASELDILGTQVVVNYYASLKYSDFKINEDIVNKLADKKKEKKKRVFEITKDTLYIRVSDSLATKRDSLYWANIRVIPLDKREIISYEKKDSVQQHLDSVRKEHTNPKFSISDIFMGGKISSDSASLVIKYDGIIKAVPEYNFVDGLWIGQSFSITKKLNRHNRLQVSPYLYYTTARKRWIGGGDIEVNYAPMRLGQINISAASTSKDFNPFGIERIGNSYSSLIRGENLVYLYQKDYVSINNNIEISNGLKLIAGLEIAKRTGLSNNTAYTWGRRSRIRPNPYSGERFDYTAYNIGIDYTPYAYYSIENGAKRYVKYTSPTFFVRYLEAFSSWQTNNSQFRKVQGGFYQHINLGYFDRISYLAEGGVFFSKQNIHFADFQHFRTSNSFVNLRSPFNSFLLIDGYEIFSDKYWVRTEFNYTNKYILLKRIPILQGKMFTESLHFRSVYTPLTELYTEAGYSVNLTEAINAGAFVSFRNERYRSWGIRLSLDWTLVKDIF